MDSESVNDKKRKVAGVVGAIASTVGAITTLVFGMQAIQKEPYLNHDDDRKRYLDGIIDSESECHHMLRMNREPFFKLVALCREKCLLEDTRNIKVEEQMAEFLHTIGHNVKNQVIHNHFSRSGETVSRYFHIVLDAILSLRDDLVKQPTQDTPLSPTIQYYERFWPWFKDCVGAIDGTHIRVSVPENIRNKFRGRKVMPTQNVLAAISFDLKFTYVLAGWEGAAHDARVLDDALTIAHRLKVPEGKYYLVDAGYPNQKGFLAPFRGVKYHLHEYDDYIPTTPKEVYNNRHSSLRNAVERGFGVLKKRWNILDDSEPFFNYKTQLDLVLACCIIHNHIMEVDPDDIFIAQVDQELQAQVAQAYPTTSSSFRFHGISIHSMEQAWVLA